METRREMRNAKRRALAASVVLHVAGLLALLLLSTASGASCARPKLQDEPLFLDFTVAVPPPPPPEEAPDEPDEPDEPEPEPEPEPDPEDIAPPEPEPPKPEPPKPEPKPEPPKPKPKPDIRQNNRVTNWKPPKNAPPPSEPTLSPEEIEKLLRQGARISDRTSVPTDLSAREIAAYDNHIFETCNAAWAQPAGLGRGLSAEASLEIEANGSIKSASLSRRSGNAALDASVEQVLRSIRKLNPPPRGVSIPYRRTVTFEVTD